MQDNVVRVSAIMPVYNVAGFVRRAVESMLAQDLPDIELICVDDGSSDGSGEILDELAARDVRMKVIHQANAGAAAARNAAIEIARGEYLYFCDGDDWAEPDMLRRMVQRADETHAELVVAGFYIETYSDDTHFVRDHIHRPDALLEQAEFRRAAYDYFDCNLLYPPWNKLYRADVVRQRGIRFRNVKMDDFPFNLDYIRDVERVAVTHNAYYHFMRERTESETARYNPGLTAKREEEHGWMKELYEYWGLSDDPAACEMIARRYIERIFGVVENITCAASPLTPKEKRAEIAKVLASPEIGVQLPRMKPRSVMMKIMLLPVRFHSVYLTYLLGCAMSFVRHRFSGLFARLKAGR